ncbi:MAG: hypothetical protein M3Q32_08820 [Pseudomonadota bacterium]|nr:hypothetical protein [Pseudomonadota bacterium]
MQTTLSATEDGLLFHDARSCKRWLSALALTNAQLAHREISAQLAKQQEAQLSGLERLKILELLREPVAFVQDQYRKIWAGKAFPLTNAEQSQWADALVLWRLMSGAYRRCLKAFDDGNREIAEHAPLICQRCLYYLVRQAAEIHSVYRQVDAAFWQDLHELYEYAEEQGFATRKVRDKLDRDDQTSTCSARYAHALLADLANPYGLNQKQTALLDRWLDRWSKKVRLVAAYGDDDEDHKLAVDIAGRSGAQHIGIAPSGRSLRYLSVKSLSKSVRKRIALMREGHSPAELDLGDDGAEQTIAALLTMLHNQWCGSGHTRSFPRRETSDQAEVCTGIAAIHYYVGERIFAPPDHLRGYSVQEHHDLQVFGHIRGQTIEAQAAQLGFACERWRLFNESAAGYGLFRNEDSAMRIAHDQLIAVRSAGVGAFAIGAVQWLRHDSAMQLHLGVRILAGAPLAVAIRADGAGHRFTQALLLAEIPTMHTPASLLLPLGMMASGQTLELYTGRSMRVRLGAVLEKGSDFERITLEVIA